MYIPKHYAVTDRSKMCEFIKSNSFGILFSHTGSEPMASHLPFVLDQDGGKEGIILGHMAKYSAYFSANSWWSGWVPPRSGGGRRRGGRAFDSMPDTKGDADRFSTPRSGDPWGRGPERRVLIENDVFVSARSPLRRERGPHLFDFGE